MVSLRLGAQGEQWAADHLSAHGYRIVERNYRCPLGELDCVAVKDGTVVFVEVKARSTNGYGGATEAVDRRKRRKLTRLARYYVKAKGLEGVPLRFDVVAVTVRGGRSRIEIFENAFDAEG